MYLSATVAISETCTELPELNPPEVLEELAECSAILHVPPPESATETERKFAQRALHAVGEARRRLHLQTEETFWSGVNQLGAVAQLDAEPYGFGNALINLAACLAHSGLVIENLVLVEAFDIERVDSLRIPCATWSRVEEAMRTSFLGDQLPECSQNDPVLCVQAMLEKAGSMWAAKPEVIIQMSALGGGIRPYSEVYDTPSTDSREYAAASLLSPWLLTVTRHDTLLAIADMRTQAGRRLADVPQPTRNDLVPAWFLQSIRPGTRSVKRTGSSIRASVNQIFRDGYLRLTWTPIVGTPDVLSEPAEMPCDPSPIPRPSGGNWVSCYVEIQSDILAEEPFRGIDPTKPIYLDVISSVTDPQYGWVSNPQPHDTDGDGLEELMVKFAREDLIEAYGQLDEIRVFVRGNLINDHRLGDYYTLRFSGPVDDGDEGGDDGDGDDDNDDGDDGDSDGDEDGDNDNDEDDEEDDEDDD